MVFGEITTKAKVDYEAVVRKVCNDVGFTSEAAGLDGNNCRVLVELHGQSPDLPRRARYGHQEARGDWRW